MWEPVSEPIHAVRTAQHVEIEHCIQIGLKGFWNFYKKKAKLSATI
jgi:hypothetical protein